MVDMDQFAQQIMPLVIFMILLPGVLILLYLTILRPMMRKYAQNQLDKIKPTPAAVGVGSLDILRQAQLEASGDDLLPVDPRPNTGRKVDTGDLPDLGMLLNPTSLKKDLSAAPVPAPAVPAPAPRPSPSALRQIPETPQRLKLNTGETTQAKEMLTVLRDENDGRLMVQIGATGYRSLADSPEAKKLFTALMKELSGSIMTPDSRPTPVVADTPPAAPAPVEIPSTPPVSSSLSALRELGEAAPAPKPAARPVVSEPRRTVAPPPLPDGSIPGALPSYKFDDNPAKVSFRRDGTVKKVDFVPPPAVDIPSAIEAYLQYKLQYTPEYQGPALHIRSGLGGGVRIQVGDLFYEAVDEVEDTEARTLLKEAIAEWQERQ